jgi:hypothetical protein
MKVPCIASFVSLTLALATPSVALAQAPTAVQDGPRPVRFELDASAVGDRALGLEDLLREKLAPVFEANQAELVDMSRSEVPHLRVRIGGKFKDIELFKYELHFELVEGDNVTKLIDPVVCEKCYDDVIVSTVGAQVPTLLEAVDARTAAVDPGDGDSGDGDTGDGDTGDGDTGDGDSTPTRKPIGPIGGVGIGVAAAGLGITIAGAVQWSRGRVPDDDLTRRTSEGRDYTGQGQLLVGLGAGALVVGVVMLAVDLGVLAKRRNGAARAQLLPTIGPERAGIVVQGRF